VKKKETVVAFTRKKRRCGLHRYSKRGRGRKIPGEGCLEWGTGAGCLGVTGKKEGIPGVGREEGGRPIKGREALLVLIK